MGVLCRKLFAVGMIFCISQLAHSQKIPDDAKKIIDRINANWDSRFFGYCDSAKPFSQSLGCFQLVKAEEGKWHFILKKVVQYDGQKEKVYQGLHVTGHFGAHTSAALVAAHGALGVNKFYGVTDEEYVDGDGNTGRLIKSNFHPSLRWCAKTKTTNTDRLDSNPEIVGESVEVDPAAVWVGHGFMGSDEFLTIHNLPWGKWRKVVIENVADGDWIKGVRNALAEAILQNRLVRFTKSAAPTKGWHDAESRIKLEITDKQVPKDYDSIRAMAEACDKVPSPKN